MRQWRLVVKAELSKIAVLNRVHAWALAVMRFFRDYSQCEAVTWVHPGTQFVLSCGSSDSYQCDSVPVVACDAPFWAFHGENTVSNLSYGSSP
jgi:hypothetical protein